MLLDATNISQKRASSSTFIYSESVKTNAHLFSSFKVLW